MHRKQKSGSHNLQVQNGELNPLHGTATLRGGKVGTEYFYDVIRGVAKEGRADLDAKFYNGKFSYLQ